LGPDGEISIDEFWDDFNFSWTCPADGMYYFEASAYWYWYYSDGPVYHLKMTRISNRFNHGLELLRQDNLHEALGEFLSLLESRPEDPELNLYVAVLRLLDVVETPDSRFVELLNAFGATAALIPDATFVVPAPLPESATSCAEVLDYAVDELLPKIDASLANLAKVSSVTDVEIEVVGSLASDAPWFVVDRGDAFILQGALCVVKAMIHALDAYNLDIDANVIDTAHHSKALPSDVGQIIAEHPRLLTAQSEVSEKLNLALAKWLEASSLTRSGIQFKSEETGYQGDDLFSIEPQDAAYTANFMSLMDRVFEGLLQVTAGDLNADGRINTKDLLYMQMLWHREI